MYITYAINENVTVNAKIGFVNSLRCEIEDLLAVEELRLWLANPDNRSDENYSDIYKDIYGYRPRW